MDFTKDYYKILGVQPGASHAEMKAAYRKKMWEYHPDRNKDNPEATGMTQLLNEAWEILGNEINRNSYDEYRRKEEEIKEKQKSDERKESGTSSTSGNKKTYTKKTVIKKERKIYVKGKIRIKYWSAQDDYLTTFIMREVYYKLHPTEAIATISQSDIYPDIPPIHFQRGHSSTEIFKTPIPQPVKCNILKDGEVQFFNINLLDIRIVDPKLSDITNFNNQNLGILSGEFYAYFIKIEEEEKHDTVTECSGETGNVESKTENERIYTRREYYHSDCSTFWGPWETEYIPDSTRTNTTKNQAVNYNTGCASWIWIPLILLLLAVWPKFVLTLLAIGLFVFLISFIAEYIGLIFGLFYIGFLIYTLINSSGSLFSRNDSSEKRRERKEEQYVDSSRSKISSIDTVFVSDTSGKLTDQLLTHYVEWQDYESNKFSINLSIALSELKNAQIRHSQSQPDYYQNTLGPVYSQMANGDETGLNYIYQKFDSLRSANNFNDAAFAKAIVSCVQSIDYFLVLEQSCNDNNYADPFIRDYLRTCNRDCCVGDVLFGVRSPIEFMSDLKGDCDTRSLFLYTVLKHYNYDVALLTSQYYKHAVLAIHSNGIEPIDGVSLPINGKNYYLWETTNSGFQPGRIPPENSNISYWDIALLNEKK